ncbi:hypothetical protein GCM10009765_58640 [Fodinicola feengrottensis]|uniref:CPXCG motif-containing cysteine-rich protein n=2 Tax=Fodinicola feengrottensis TaxID=435914 RepID=A0ABP4UAI0_9ACTN
MNDCPHYFEHDSEDRLEDGLTLTIEFCYLCGARRETERDWAGEVRFQDIALEPDEADCL